MSSDRAPLPESALRELNGSVGTNTRGDRDGRGLRLAFACGLFNGDVTWRLLKGALAEAAGCGVDGRDISVAWAPGAFELPLVANALAITSKFDAVICLGAVIRGETGHYEVVASQCAAGIQRVQLDTGVPVMFGVLTTETLDQAMVRSADDADNKGRESVSGAVEMIRLLRSASFQPSGSIAAGTGGARR